MILHYSIEYLPSQGTIAASKEFRYFLILEGQGECTARHQGFPLELHDVLALPQNTDLSITAERPIMAGCIRVFDMLTPRAGLYHLPGRHTGFLRQTFYLAMDIQTVEEPYYDNVRNAMDQLVFSALIATELAADQLKPVVVNVVQQIISNFTDPDFDLRNVIDQTGYTVNHFRKIFRDEVGMPPLEFLNNRRIDYAKELFRRWGTRLSISEIAHACGFRDEYYFSRYFKRKEGKPPSQYVEELRNSHTDR